MNSKKIAEAFGGINDRYLNEALEYKRGSQRGGITMSKKKIAVLAAVIAAIILTFPAAAVIKNYWKPVYYGSLEDGTAITAPNGSVELTAVTVSDSEVAFVLNVDNSVYPFNEYTEVLITSAMLWEGDEPIVGQSADMLHSTPDWFDIYSGWFGLGSEGEDMEIICKFYDGAYHVNFENRTSENHAYTFVAYALTGRNAEGRLMEIRGEWAADFTI